MQGLVYREFAIAAALAALAFPARADDPVVIEAPAQAAGMAGTLDPGSDFSYAADTTDRAVAERVMDALARDPALDGAAITVLVDQGAVRLAGTARDADQAADAVRVAREAAGPAVAVSGDGIESAGANAPG